MTFYRDVLGLPVIKSLTLPNDYGYGLQVGDGGLLLWIGKHSEVHGYNSEPVRHIFNLYTPDVNAWYEKLKTRSDVKIIAEPFRTPPSTDDNPRYAFTFLDPEGNCLQFMNP